MRSSLSALLDGRFAPQPAERRVGFLHGRRFAHRGLHGDGIIENSRAAFAAAIAAGDGIECDVQLSADGTAFVFHDDSLDRLTDRTGPVSALSRTEIARIELRDAGETIPTLEEILALIAGHVPLLVEIKAPGRHIARHCLAVRRAIEGYRGDVAVMSFNPQVCHWFAAYAPRVARGLVISEEDKSGPRGAVERHLSLWRAKPDFLAYDVRDLPSRFATAQRARGLPVLTWTVRSAEEQATASLHADAPIYEQHSR